MSEFALPWGNNPQQGQNEGARRADAAETAGNVTYLKLEDVGVSVGGRIEVKWQVEPDDGAAYTRWWGASIVGPSDQQSDQHPGAPVYEIAYDALDEFEQERSHIIFTEDHTLFQLDQTDELSWRREGDTWEDEEEDEEEDAAGEETTNGEALVTMDHLKQMVNEERNYLGGKTLEEAEQEVLGSLEPRARIAVAAGFRDFADNLISFLHTKMADGGEGGGLTVTEEHVRAFAESMKKRQRTT